jgi:hypothetical protein
MMMSLNRILYYQAQNLEMGKGMADKEEKRLK